MWSKGLGPDTQQTLRTHSAASSTFPGCYKQTQSALAWLIRSGQRSGSQYRGSQQANLTAGKLPVSSSMHNHQKHPLFQPGYVFTSITGQ